LPGRLLGRERELAKLAELLQAASSGGGAFAWLEGEAGIGKTRVLDATAQIARERGFTVLSAAAQELEAHRPFAVVADCLRVDLCEFTRAEELLALVEAETARSPVMFVLDDLQWADPSSLAFLGRLALELPACRLWFWRRLVRCRAGQSSSVSRRRSAPAAASRSSWVPWKRRSARR